LATFLIASGAKLSDTPPWWSSFGSSLQNITNNYFAPFLNTSVFHLMKWFYNESNSKSLTDLDNLVDNVILAENFKKEDFVGFHAKCEAECLDKADTPQSHFLALDGWNERGIKISVEKVKHAIEADAPQFEVPGLFHHCLIHVIKAVLQETATKSYHLFPFRKFWQPSPDMPPEHIWSELYTADAFIAEHEKIQLHPQEDGLENVIIGLMLWSDLTSVVMARIFCSFRK
jgi:hypothetical protein